MRYGPWMATKALPLLVLATACHGPEAAQTGDVATAPPITALWPGPPSPEPTSVCTMASVSFGL